MAGLLVAGVWAEAAETRIRTANADVDLLEVNVPRLHSLYASHRYTVTQVVQWYLARIARYNGIYRALETVDMAGALKAAAQEDADAKVRPAHGDREPLWGVPIVIKGNTSLAGLVTTDGWQGFTVAGHELQAPRDATVVKRLRDAGAIILGRSNMPDFAASDTNRSTSFGRTGNAYDVRFSPGGSSGGTVTAITANFALLGTGTDTSNSIRMPSGTSSVVGLLPTRGLVSIAGIAPLDWLLDNTGPIARDVTDVAIALGAMAGEDPLDFRTSGSQANAQPAPYTQYLKADSLHGKRFGVPAFILAGNHHQGNPRPETRALFLKAVEALHTAGATIVYDDGLLPATFLDVIRKVSTQPYRLEGTDNFLKNFGPPQYHSAREYEATVGHALPGLMTGAPDLDSSDHRLPQAILESDPAAEANFFSPQRAALALYLEALDRFHLDGFIYPSAQMPPPDETMPQEGTLSSGPHSATGWVNRIGVPAIVVPGGFYPGGLPFGLELSGRPWRDGDLLGWAYAFEQATHYRHAPVLVDRGLLPAPTSDRQ